MGEAAPSCGSALAWSQGGSVSTLTSSQEPLRLPPASHVATLVLFLLKKNQGKTTPAYIQV